MLLMPAQCAVTAGIAMTIFDYVGIGVLIVLIVWTVADGVPRRKL